MPIKELFGALLCVIYFPNLEVLRAPRHTGTGGGAGVKSRGKAGPTLLAGRWTRCSWVLDVLEAQEEAAEQVSPITHALGLSCLEESLRVCRSRHPYCDCSLSCRPYSFIVNRNHVSSLRNATSCCLLTCAYGWQLGVGTQKPLSLACQDLR